MMFRGHYLMPPYSDNSGEGLNPQMWNSGHLPASVSKLDCWGCIATTM